jgi:hypothetical protein
VFFRTCLLALCGLLLTLSGCQQDGPQVVRVRGVATTQGQPLANVVLQFTPGEGRPSNAFTDAEGKFDVDYSRSLRGLLLTEYSVWIEHPYLLMQREGMVPPGEQPPSAAILEICRKYSTPEQGLKVTITKAEHNLELKFD